MDTCSFHHTGISMRLTLRQKCKLSGKILFFGGKNPKSLPLSLKKPRIDYFSQCAQWQKFSGVWGGCVTFQVFSIIWQLSFRLKIPAYQNYHCS